MGSLLNKNSLKYLLFATSGTILVLWSLLLPGYVLLLDWGVGPYSLFSYHDVASFMNVPSNALIYVLGMFLPGWMVQKLMLFGVVFALFYLPLRFFPWSTVHQYVPYVVSLIAVSNPFVYERLLAGQWRVVFGYACLYPLVYFLLKLNDQVTWPLVAKIFTTILLIGFVSIHYLAAGLVVTLVFTLLLGLKLYRASDYQGLKVLFARMTAGALAYAGVSLYWLVPYFMQSESVLQEFSREHFFAFATVRDGLLGSWGNVLVMKGFWLEGQFWAEQFRLPATTDWLFVMALAGQFVLVGLGFWRLVSEESQRWQGRVLVWVGLLASVSAAGVSAAFVWPVNLWLLENIPFWSGFRDTQKWVGVVVVVYSLLAGMGVQALVQNCSSKLRRGVVLVGACLVPLCLVPYIWFGFGGQVQTVEIPDGWQLVAAELEKEPDCRAVFLPWQQYYRLKWNDGQLVVNPSSRAFPCEVVAGKNTNLGNILPIAGDIAGYTELEKIVTSNALAEEKIASAVAGLRAAGVTHIIASDSLVGTDIYMYPFLLSPELTQVMTEGDLELYRID